MPPAKHIYSNDLAIEVDDIGRPHHAGDHMQLTGRVVRHAPADSPEATLKITLLGRAKAKLTVTKAAGLTTSTSHRGRFNFFHAALSMRMLHNHAPLTVPDGAHASWPFAFTIPTRPSSGAILGSHVDDDSSFLRPLDHGLIATAPAHQLPGSFRVAGRQARTDFEAYVQYHLRAVLVLVDNDHRCIPWTERCVATLPVRIAAAPRSLDYDPAAAPPVGVWLAHRSVASYRLVPDGMGQHQGRALGQRTRQALRSAVVPSLGFTAYIHHPTAIQLGGGPVPFRVRLRPDLWASSRALHGVPVFATVTKLELTLCAVTAVIAPGQGPVPGPEPPVEASAWYKARVVLPVFKKRSRPVRDNNDDDNSNDKNNKNINKINDEDGALPKNDPPRPSSSSSSSPTRGEAPKAYAIGPIRVPIRWEDNIIGDYDAPPPAVVDIGALLDLHIDATGVTMLGGRARSSFSSPMYPSFTTYCIKHTHMMKWKLVVRVAGERARIVCEHPVVVVGPGDSLYKEEEEEEENEEEEGDEEEEDD